jgi:hypothetical protein
MEARDARDSLRAAVARVLIALANVSPTTASAKANWPRKRLSSSLTARPSCYAPRRMKHARLRPGSKSELIKRVAHIDGVNILVVQPPSPVPGAGGFSLRLEDRAGLGKDALAKATNALVTAATPRPGTRHRGSARSAPILRLMRTNDPR